MEKNPSLFIDEKHGSVSLLINDHEAPRYMVMLAHGAGTNMNHTFMRAFAEELSALGCLVIRFNFPYVEAGRKAPGSPNSAILAIDKVAEFALSEFSLPLFMIGKSYGGRMQSHWSAQNPNSDLRGLVYLGFPLHPPGNIGTSRANHLSAITVPQLFLQGTKDKLATRQLIDDVVGTLSKANIHMIEDADHSFKVPKRTGKTHEEIISELVQKSNQWISAQLKQ